MVRGYYNARMKFDRKEKIKENFNFRFFSTSASHFYNIKPYYDVYINNNNNYFRIF